MSFSGRPLRYNLRRDGWGKCAAYVDRVVRYNRGAVSVYVAPDGGLRAWLATERRCKPRPDHELVGIYNKQAQPEMIEDDLIVRLREIQE